MSWAFILIEGPTPLICDLRREPGRSKGVPSTVSSPACPEVRPVPVPTTSGRNVDLASTRRGPQAARFGFEPAMESLLGEHKTCQAMRFENFVFGCIRIDGRTYEHDVVIDHGVVRKREKKASRPLRAAYGHTPLSMAETIPWDCRRLVVGTGMHGALPIVPELSHEARRRCVELVALPTADAISLLQLNERDTNAVLHLTC